MTLSALPLNKYIADTQNFNIAKVCRKFETSFAHQKENLYTPTKEQKV